MSVEAIYRGGGTFPAQSVDIEVTPSPSFSLYRTPSLSAGGMVSFIDDDGRDSVATKLYPFMKANNAPFGTAINTDRIGKTGTFINGGSTMTLEQLKDIAADTDIVEVMSHGFGHVKMAEVSQKEREYELWQSRKWFLENGFDVSGYVFPHGSDNAVARATVQRYYQSAYDYIGDVRVETFNTIRNNLISRTAWDFKASNLASHKALVDEVVVKNGWLVICTHIDSHLYWNENSFNELQELIDYIKAKNIPIVRPKDGFQTFGNIMENDSGFKIQADGRIVGAT